MVAAIRYTFADSSQSHDGLLAPVVVQVLELVKDSDLVSAAPEHFFGRRLLTTSGCERRFAGFR